MNVELVANLLQPFATLVNGRYGSRLKFVTRQEAPDDRGTHRTGTNKRKVEVLESMCLFHVIPSETPTGQATVSILVSCGPSRTHYHWC